MMADMNLVTLNIAMSMLSLSDTLRQGAPKLHQFLLLSRTVAFPARAAVMGKPAQPYLIINF